MFSLVNYINSFKKYYFQLFILCIIILLGDVIMSKKNTEKKKKLKINWNKVAVWIALIAMVASAFAAILSPLFSR